MPNDPLHALRVLVAFAATHTGDGATPEEGRLLDAYGEGVAEAVREGRKALADLDALLDASWADATDALNRGCPRCSSRTCDGGCALPATKRPVYQAFPSGECEACHGTKCTGSGCPDECGPCGACGGTGAAPTKGA